MAVQSSSSNFILTDNAQLLLKSNSNVLRDPKSDFFSKYSKIERCECQVASRFNRAVLETHLVQTVSTTFSEDKKKTLTVLSGGSGGCMEELVVLTQLLNEGFSDIDFSFVDPTYLSAKQSSEMPFAQQVRSCIETELLPSFNKPAITTHFYQTLDEYFADVKEGKNTVFKVGMFVDLLVASKEDEKSENALDSCLKKLKENKALISQESVLAYNYLAQPGNGDTSVYAILPWSFHSREYSVILKKALVSERASYFETKKQSGMILDKLNADEEIEGTFHSIAAPEGQKIS